MFSDFQMEGYEIEKLTLDLTVEASADSNESLQYYANFRRMHEDGIWKGDVALGFRPLSKENCSPHFEVIIIGHFSMQADDSSESENKFVRMLQVNGAAAIIPIARAAIVASAGIMRHPDQFVLPSINVYSLDWNDIDKAELE